MAETYANDALTTLASVVLSGDTTITVSASTGFPAVGNFRVRIDAEILLVTALAGNVWTVTRAAEVCAGAQTATNHSSGAQVAQVLTVAALVPTGRQVIAGSGLSGGGPLTADVSLANAGVVTFNGRTGGVTLTSSDVTTALGDTHIVYTDVANTFTLGQTVAPTSGVGASLTVKESTAGVTNAAAEFHAKNQSSNYGPFAAYNDTSSTSVPVCYFFGYNDGKVSFGSPNNKAVGFFARNGYNSPQILIGGDSGFGNVTIGDGVSGTTLATPVAIPANLYSFNSPTNAVLLVGGITHDAGSASAGIGVGFGYYCRDSTGIGTDRLCAETDGVWATATHASRKGRWVAGAHDAATSAGAPREGFRVESDGSNPLISFYGGGATGKPTITGTRDGNAALASLLSALAGQTLLTDSTTAGSSGGSPAGSDTWVQFNDGGSFGGDSGFVYDKTNKQLAVTASNGSVAMTGSSPSGGIGGIFTSAGYSANVGDAAHGYAGKFTDGTLIALLGDGTYAINATVGGINSASGYYAGGTAPAADGTYSNPTSITIKGGIITAIS